MKNIIQFILLYAVMTLAPVTQAETIYKCIDNNRVSYQKAQCKANTGESMDIKPLQKSGLSLSDSFNNYIDDYRKQQYEIEQHRIAEVKRQEELNIERQKVAAQREEAAAVRREAAAQRDTARAIRESSLTRYPNVFQYPR